MTLHRILLISGIVAGAVVLIAGGLTAYAFFNLSSIVAHNEKRILARVSNELGRRVEVAKIQAQVGWGVSVEVSGLTIADDPAFSAKPFLAANDVSIDVEFFPLLYGDAKVVRLELVKPDIRIVMNADGDLNVSSLGVSPEDARRESESARRWHAKKRSSLGDLSIKALSIEDGEVHFKDLSQQAAPIHVRHLDFDVTDFNAASAFDVETKFAFPAEQQNVEASGKLGPLLEKGVLDASGIPVDLNLKIDSILLDNLRPLAEMGSKIPAGLSIPDAASVSGTARGSFGQLAIALSTDLTANRVAYATIFDKPAGTAMTINANGTWGDQLEIASVSLKLSDLELTASRFSSFSPGPQPFSAQIDSNSFNLANLGPMISAVAGYDLAGMSEIHGTVQLGANAPAIDGTVTLKQAAMKLGPSVQGGISDLNGTIRFADGIGVVEPTTFTLGSAHANLEGRVESVNPLNASYALKADAVKLAQIFASRPPGDVVNGLTVKGTADGAIASPRISATIQSTDGSLENVSYRNLDLTAAYFNGRASARPLNAGVFGGSLTANADAVLGDVPRFNITLAMRSLNMEQALRSQNIDAAGRVHGFLTGNVAASGSGADWNRIRPTIRGSGRVAIANGKLVGVNIVADALNAVAAAPGVSQLVNVGFRSSHHGLLVDPDTELQSASMSFQQTGPRFTTHDLYAQSPDYAITGDGWFDMDKNIEMNADIRLTLGLQVAIPVTVSGQLPGVRVLPDVPTLAERVAMGAINTPGNIIRGGVNAVGSIVGAPSAGSAIPSIPNPIDAIKKFLP
ncbi:MAG: AsmA-like C-terminal region-containing protein [Candidatus Binatus sp.]